MKCIQLFSFLIFLFTNGLSAQTFQHDMRESLALAKGAQKEVLIIFSGSDWCKPCIQLKKTILHDEDFINFSEENLVLLELDFPYKKKNKLPKEQREHNEQLAEKYNQEGAFPKVVLLDADEKVIGQVSYRNNMLPEQFINQITALKAKK